MTGSNRTACRINELFLFFWEMGEEEIRLRSAALAIGARLET